jgi:polygalacturonase
MWIVRSDPFEPPKFPKPKFRDAQYNVKDFGAKGDGTTNDTPAINKAINEAHNDGGGDIVFPAGTYEAASIQIKSNVRFVLDAKAVISGTVRITSIFYDQIF